MTRTARILGVPADYGANRRGVDMGPSAIRYAGLGEALGEAGVEPVDHGDITAPRAEETDPEAETPGLGRARFLREVRRAATALADDVAKALAAEAVPLVLGGDHSVSIGSLSGTSRDAEVGVVWFDAHGDFNTPATTPSGNVHGMSLAAALGLGEFGGTDWAPAPGLSAEHVALVGIRDLDEREKSTLQASDASVFTMSDIDELGILPVVEEALSVALTGTDGVHASLDLDWLDPTIAPGVGTPVRGGVSYREAHSAMEAIAECGQLRSIDLVEVNPILDTRNETAELAAELAASAFGKRIL
jgi:arginase